MSLIATDGLTKQYPGGVTALDGLTVAIEPGIIGLVGSNGAGKSTLLKVLLGLLEPTAGRATIFDLDVATRGVAIRELVGYMPEHDCLPPDMTATDIVSHLALISGLPRAAARERTAEVLRHVGLYEERYRAIGGYSTGMKQRVKLAQALVHDPRLLLLDEPTNGLDPAGRDEMLELIHRTGSEFGIAVIVASHLLGEIERVCDHLVAIEGGRLLRSAPLRSFTERTGTLAVEVEDGREILVERLAARGLRVVVDGPAVLVDLVDETPFDIVRDTVARGLRVVVDGPAVLVDLVDETPFDIVRDTVVELDLALVRMEQRRHRLEDLFRDAPAAGTAPGDGAGTVAAATATAPAPGGDGR